jgi:probable HAF family extracellular repeat protein
MRAIIVMLFLTTVQASTIYSVTDLGSFGGTSASAVQINESGVAAGWATNAFGNQVSFSSTGAGLFDALSGLAGASDSYAYGINASGVVVGISYVNGQPHGEIWNGGAATDMGAGTFATAINDAGAVAGGNGHAFVLVNGAYQDLGVLRGGGWSAAYAINNAGEVAGYGNTPSGAFRAFYWTPSGGMVELGTLGGQNSYAAGINSSGEIVGNASLANGYSQAFVAVGQVMIDLGTLGGMSSAAYGINDSGVIVGYSTLSDGATTRAFVYVNGVMTDLNSLIPSGSGWRLLEAYGINNAGQIVGEGFLNGRMHAFRLDPQQQTFSLGAFSANPVPDPGTGSLSGIGLALLFVSLLRGHGMLR